MEDNGGIMGIKFSNGLLAGVTAAVIWISICLMVGTDAETVGLWALIFLVIGTVGTVLISGVVEKNRGGTRT